MRRKKSKFTKAEVLNRAISQWENRQDAATTMLRKSAEMLLKLRKQRQRMLARQTTAESKVADDLTVSIHAVLAENRRQHDRHADEDIPTFLDRTAGNDKDAAARAEIEAQQAEKKKRAADRSAEKRKIKKETTHAELTGQRRKMPLSGKAALAAIHAK